MKLDYTQTKYKETNKSGAVVHWYQSNTGAWVLNYLELGHALGLTKKLTEEQYRLLPAELQTVYLHRVGTELFLRQLYAVTEGRSRKLWNVVQDSFYMEAPESKWDIPVLAYRQGAKTVLAVASNMLFKFKVHPASGAASWSTEDCINVEVGNITLQAVPLDKLITLDAQYNEFAAQVLKLGNEATLKDFKACMRQAAKIKQLTAETEPLDEKAKAFKLRKDLNTALAESERLRNMLHKHGIDPAGRATHESTDLAKSTNKASASLVKQRESTQKALQQYIAHAHGLLKAQTCLLESASEEMHKHNPKWRHTDFLKLFSNDTTLSVLRAAQDDLKAKDEDATDLITVEKFVMNHIGYRLPLLRDMVENAEKIDRQKQLEKRKQ